MLTLLYLARKTGFDRAAVLHSALSVSHSPPSSSVIPFEQCPTQGKTGLNTVETLQMGLEEVNALAAPFLILHLQVVMSIPASDQTPSSPKLFGRFSKFVKSIGTPPASPTLPTDRNSSRLSLSDFLPHKVFQEAVGVLPSIPSRYPLDKSRRSSYFNPSTVTDFSSSPANGDRILEQMKSFIGLVEHLKDFDNQQVKDYLEAPITISQQNDPQQFAKTYRKSVKETVKVGVDAVFKHRVFDVLTLVDNLRSKIVLDLTSTLNVDGAAAVEGVNQLDLKVEKYADRLVQFYEMPDLAGGVSYWLPQVYELVSELGLMVQDQNGRLIPLDPYWMSKLKFFMISYINKGFNHIKNKYEQRILGSTLGFGSTSSSAAVDKF
ncbi:hypothetical protein T439DRAFT_383722 [Meredithblackwellia eburnea MCA 4105]